jgi:hypothetical protein
LGPRGVTKSVGAPGPKTAFSIGPGAVPRHAAAEQVPREPYSILASLLTDFFEHLDATIAEATPLYELCASVLGSTLP